MASTHLKRRSGRSSSARRRARWLVVFLALGSIGTANAQTSPSTQTAADPGTRAELLELLRRTDEGIRDATSSGRQQDVTRLRELKAQFELLLLQAELEGLQRQNDALLAQQGGDAQTPEAPATAPAQADVPGAATAAESDAESEISGMREQFTQLDAQQTDVIAQLDKIADQHAILLEQLGSATSSAAAPAEPATEPISQVQQELSALQQRFAQLTSQQGVVNTRLQSITDDHAALLNQLASVPEAPSAASPAPSRTHIVQAGDSLSKLAQSYYGTGSRWLEILQANPFLTNPNRLLVGTELTIP